MRYFILGGYGIIGRVVAEDIFKNKNAEIIIAGRDFDKAKKFADSFKSKKVKAEKINIDKNLSEKIKGSDVLINCLQYYFNVNVMKACIKAKVNYVDLGGLFHETKKQLKLNKEFKRINKIAVIGCGSTPGITNIMAEYGAEFLKKIDSTEITFANYDKTKYKQKFVLPYSFKTIIDEYTKKPAVFQNGKIKFVEPGSGIKTYNFDKPFGKATGFYTLHSELATFPSSFKNKGLKSCEFRATFSQDFSNTITDLIELGFASEDSVIFSDKKIRVIDGTTEIMNRLVPKNQRIYDQEIVRVIFNEGKIIMDAAAGSSGDKPAGVYDTGVPCSIIAQMIGKINMKGVFPPEKIINPIEFFRELKKRGIRVLKNSKEIG